MSDRSIALNPFDEDQGMQSRQLEGNRMHFTGFQPRASFSRETDTALFCQN